MEPLPSDWNNNGKQNLLHVRISSILFRNTKQLILCFLHHKVCQMCMFFWDRLIVLFTFSKESMPKMLKNHVINYPKIKVGKKGMWSKIRWSVQEAENWKEQGFKNREDFKRQVLPLGWCIIRTDFIQSFGVRAGKFQDRTCCWEGGASHWLAGRACLGWGLLGYSEVWCGP